MRHLIFAVLYTALSLTATSASADMSHISDLREGTLKKLVLHAEAKPSSSTPFFDAEDTPLTFADLSGKYLLVNFWATWCAPCRHEMPSLNALAKEFNSDRFEVVTIATGRNPVPSMKKFFAENAITDLPLYRDPKQQLARDMAVLGLPITVILDPEGREIARLRGDAEWYSDSARAIISSLLTPAS